MTFDYNVYYTSNLVIPLIIFLFAFLCFIAFAITSIREISKYSFSFYKKNWFRNVIITFILLLLMTIGIIPLAKGGVYLLTENESNSVMIEGIVSRTFDNNLSMGTKYHVNGDTQFGGGIVIDSEIYYCVSYGDIEVGDYVLLKVLPKSKLILEWTKINGELSP